MSYKDYVDGRDIAAKYSFEALIMGFMRIADDDNRTYLMAKYPQIWAELKARYNSPGGLLPGEKIKK